MEQPELKAKDDNAQAAAQHEWKKDWTKEVWNVNWSTEKMTSLGTSLAALWVLDSYDSKYEMITVTRDNAPEIAIWSAEFLTKVVSFKDEYLPSGLDVVPNTGRAVVCGSYTNSAYSVWDLEKGERLRKYERSDPRFDSVIICDGSILLGTYNGIAVFDLETGRPGKKINISTEGMELRKDPTRPSLVYAADKKKSTISAYDMRASSTMPARSLSGLPNAELADINMRIYGQENMLVAATSKQVRVFDVSNGKTIHIITHLPEYRSYRQVDIAKGYVVVALDYVGLHFYNITGGDVKEPEYELSWSGLQAYKMAATPDTIFINYVTNLHRAMLP